MNEFLNEYSLDRACDEIATLDIHSSAYDLRLFSEAVLKYARASLRSESGIDPLAICSKEEWFDRFRGLLRRHQNLDNDMAFIVAAHEVEWATRKKASQ